jgi:type III pantothenate kinase
MSSPDMSTWLFDLGNSRLKCAPVRDGRIGEAIAIDHDGTAFAPGWEQRLPARFDDAVVASVAASPLAVELLDALTRRCARISLARTQAAFDGVRIAYAQPSRLGVDRFLALLAAHARETRPALVVGIGTALTIDLLDAGGLHRGGRIAPSPALMRAALHARAPQLPIEGGAWREFADDTADALASGCDGAALGLIEGSLRAAATLLSEPPRLLLHGGGATALLPRLGDAVHAPALVLEGLARWARNGG